jgi:hypothetical protein
MKDCARLSDGNVVYIYGYANGLFSTVRIEESRHMHHGLTPWAPAPGEAMTPEGEPVWDVEVRPG